MFTGFMAAAHRGGRLHGPNLGRENTLHAFGQAVALGYDVLETDIRTTADGHVVVFHDSTLGRLTDSQGRIRDLPLKTVKRARVGGIDEIPTLEEMLEAFPTQRLLIDLKDAASVRLTIDVLRRHKAIDRACVGSFGEFRLRRYRLGTNKAATTSAGHLEVGLQRFAPRLAEHLPRPAVFQIPITYTQRPVRVRLLTREFVENAHARNSAVHVWTVNTTQAMHEVLDLGVDGIITDATDVLRSVLIERGLWGER